MNKRIISSTLETPGRVGVYYKALNDWEQLYPSSLINDGYAESTKAIAENKKNIERLYLRKYMGLRDGRTFLDLDTTQRVMDPKELLAKEILIVLPHNDDICWAYNLFQGQREAGAKLQTMLFASDCSGISATYAARYAEKYLVEDYSLDKLKSALSQERIKEYTDITARLGGETLQLPVSVEQCYEPTKVVKDSHGLYSYLSEYRDFSQDERRLVMDFFKSKMIHWATSHWHLPKDKLAIITPFIFDNHPVHRMLFKLILEAFLEVPEKYKASVRLFMYPSLDVLQDRPGSVYYTFGEEGRTKKFYAWKEMNTQLQRNEDFYLRRFPQIDSANAKQCKPPTNDPYAEKLIELKYRKNNPIPH